MIATRHITVAELLSIHTTPIVIVPTPGPGKVIVLVGAALRLNFGSTNFVSTGFNLFLGNSSVNELLLPNMSTFLNQSGDTVYAGGGAGQWDADASMADLPLVADATADPTLGDSTVDVTVFYQIASVPLP